MGLGFKDRASVNHEGFGLAFWQICLKYLVFLGLKVGAALLGGNMAIFRL
jgi:hypothetical protein